MEISNLNLALKESEYLLSLLMTSFMSFSKEKQEIQKNLAGEYCPCVKEKYLTSLTRSLTFSNSSVLLSCVCDKMLRQEQPEADRTYFGSSFGVLRWGSHNGRSVGPQRAARCCSVSVLQHLSQGAAAPSPPAG